MYGLLQGTYDGLVPTWLTNLVRTSARANDDKAI